MENLWDRDIEKTINLLDNCIENPEIFLKPQSDKVEKFRNFTKFLYNAEQKSEAHERINPKGLPKLLLKHFDDEGIWQQLELQNNAAINYFKGNICNEISLINNCNGIASNEDNEFISNDDDKILSSDDNDSLMDSDDEDKNRPDGNEFVFDDDDSDLEYPVSNSKVQDSTALTSNEELDSNVQKKKLPKRSEIEDEFFNLTQMEDFLRTEDLKEMKSGDGNLSDDSDSIDMFADIPSDMDDDEEEKIENAKKLSKDIMYSDFFDTPLEYNAKTNEDLNDLDEEEELELSSKYDTRDFNPDSGDDSNDEATVKGLLDESDEEESKISSEEKKELPITPFEKQQEREKKRIHDLEESLLQPKPWQLTGEIAASSRPEDSLLRQQTTFDYNTKQNLVSTDELTARVEQVILNAVLNKAWSDVERKIKPVEDIRTFKKPIELDQTKSKKGLAEVYEDEYLKLHDKSEEKENPSHLEIKKLMDELLPELHALFAHIPRPPVPEIKVVSNLPAISVEDVAPVAISDATLLAPEEVMKKQRGDVKAQTEKSKTDKKRERRKKKIHQRLRQEKTEKNLARMAAVSPHMAKKHQKLVALKKLKQSRNAKIADNKEEKIKSSKDFFARLQEKVDTAQKKRKTLLKAKK